MILALLIAAQGTIYLQRMGTGIDAAELKAVVDALHQHFDVNVVTPDPVPLPKEAYYAPRKRYRADVLLDVLTRDAKKDATRVIGLTAVDISTTKDGVYDWGILGLGEMPGVASVISTFRCKIKAKGPAHVRERLAKVAVHEVGHTFGLDHCKSTGCFMRDGEGKVATVDGEYQFCDACKAKLAKPR